jgi:hypothetical protein
LSVADVAFYQYPEEGLSTVTQSLVFSTFVRHLGHANDGGPHRQAMEVKVADRGLLGALALPQGRATKAPPPAEVE